MAPGQIVMGAWNDYASPSLPADLIFVLGNGIEDPSNMYFGQNNPNRSNAIEVQLSGRTTIRHKNHAATSPPEALNVLGTATISRGLTVNGPASFSDNLEVAGDLKVQGTLRVPEQGDLSMGEFTSGPQP